MEIIAKISKGSKMDQIYIPKNRYGFSAGEHVLILPLEQEKGKTAEKIEKLTKEKPYFYDIKKLEPIKLIAIEKIFEVVEKEKYENIIITGSLLEKGFKFNDIDILIISKEKVNVESLRKAVENLIGIKTHILLMDNKTLIKGYSTDPLYQLMLSKCIARKRLIFKVRRKINYKLLDLHLLKSKTLTDNFDILNGDEKYYLTRNMLSILLFLEQKKINNQGINKKIKKLLKVKIEDIKENKIVKNEFIREYKKVYNKTFNLILRNIKNEQKKTY